MKYGRARKSRSSRLSDQINSTWQYCLIRANIISRTTKIWAAHLKLNEKSITPSVAIFNKCGAQIKLTSFKDSHLGERFDFSVGHKNFNILFNIWTGLAVNSFTQGLSGKVKSIMSINMLSPFQSLNIQINSLLGILTKRQLQRQNSEYRVLNSVWGPSKIIKLTKLKLMKQHYINSFAW